MTKKIKSTRMLPGIIIDAMKDDPDFLYDHLFGKVADAASMLILMTRLSESQMIPIVEKLQEILEEPRAAKNVRFITEYSNDDIIKAYAMKLLTADADVFATTITDSIDTITPTVISSVNALSNHVKRKTSRRKNATVSKARDVNPPRQLMSNLVALHEAGEWLKKQNLNDRISILTDAARRPQKLSKSDLEAYGVIVPDGSKRRPELIQMRMTKGTPISPEVYEKGLMVIFEEQILNRGDE